MNDEYFPDPDAAYEDRYPLDDNEFEDDVDETNYDPYAGCDVFEYESGGDDW